MRLSDVLGEGIHYTQLDCGPQAAMAAQFHEAAESVALQYDLPDPAYPYPYWRFHRVPDGRWVAVRRHEDPSRPDIWVIEWAEFRQHGRWTRDCDGLIAVYRDLRFLGSGL